MITLGKRKAKAKKVAFDIGKKLFPIAKTLAAPVSFIEQISAKHRQVLGSAFTDAPVTQKLKILTNIVTGSASGFNFFKDEYQAPMSQFKIENIFNKWTKTGAIMLGYGVVAKEVNKSLKMNVLPVGGKIRQIGKQLLIGGGIGGILDDKVESAQQTTQQGTAHLSPQLQTTMLVNSDGGNSFHTDSTESGM